jgi:dUTPase
MNIKVKKLKENAQTPYYQTKTANTFDIFSSEDVDWEPVICANSGLLTVDTVVAFQAIIKTGLIFDIEENYTLHIHSRNDWAASHNIQLSNGTQIVDIENKEEVIIKLIGFCRKKELPKIAEGTRIAKGEIIEIKQYDFEII